MENTTNTHRRRGAALLSLFAGSLLVMGACTGGPVPPNTQPATNDGIAAPPSPPVEGTVTPNPTPGRDSGGQIKGDQVYSWTGTVRITMLEGQHYELESACGPWTLLPENDAIAAKLKDKVGQKVTVWGTEYTGPSIYMRQTIKVTNVYGPGDPVVMPYVPEYPCGVRGEPTPPAKETPVPSGGSAGTLHGQVRIGQMCPVEPCDRPTGDLYSSRSLVLTTAGGDVMFVPLTQDGQFKSLVKPGSYKATISNCEFMGCKYATPKLVTIQPGQATYLELDIDTGIR